MTLETVDRCASLRDQLVATRAEIADAQDNLSQFDIPQSIREAEEKRLRELTAFRTQLLGALAACEALPPRPAPPQPEPPQTESR